MKSRGTTITERYHNKRRTTVKSQIPIAVLSLLLVSTLASAQEPQSNPSDSLDELMIREEFNGTQELPDGVAYRVTLEDLGTDEPDYAIRRIKKGMGVEDATAQDFYKILMADRSALANDIDLANRAHGCVGKSPVVQGEAAYHVLQSMYDVSEREGSRRYEALRRSTDPELFSKFSQWIEDRKLSIVHIRFDIREAYSRSGNDPGVALASLCDRPTP